MSNKALFSLAFIIGTVTGSVVTWYLLKDKYEALAQEEIDSVKEVFSRREQELKDKSVKRLLLKVLKMRTKKTGSQRVCKAIRKRRVYQIFRFRIR